MSVDYTTKSEYVLTIRELMPGFWRLLRRAPRIGWTAKTILLSKMTDQWSTWSPGRFELSVNDDELKREWRKFLTENLGRPNWYSYVFGNIIHHTEYGLIRRSEKRHRVTCGNCQLVCWKTRQERIENYDLLVEGGEIEEGPDFSFVPAK